MADNTSVDLAQVPGDNPVQAGPDLLRAMVQTFAEALMGAEADGLCGAPYGQPSAERVNYRNGYRQRRWDTRAGTEPVALSRRCHLKVRSCVTRSALRAGWVIAVGDLCGASLAEMGGLAVLRRGTRPPGCADLGAGTCRG